MMRVLILCMSAMRKPWGDMLRVGMETWDAEHHPQTRTIYYCGVSSQPSAPHLFFSEKFSEDLCDVSGRTIEAFEHSLTIPGWDYLARPHSSTYVDKQNLVDFCDTLPIKNVLCGLMTGGDRPFLWGGGHYIMSRDVIEKFVAHKEKWNLGVMEDEAITFAARDLGIEVRSNARTCSINEMPDKSWFVMCYGIGESFNFTEWADIKKAHPQFFFRVKQDLKRHKDLEIMREIKRHYR